MAVAQESEFLAVNQKIRVRIPAVTPLRKRAQGKVVEPSVCKTELPGASPGCASISGPSSNSRTTQWHCVDRGATPRGSTILKDTTCPDMRKTAIRAVRIGETLGAAPRCPTISNSAKALVATHAAGIGERPVQLRLADYLPCSSTARAPGSDPGG